MDWAKKEPKPRKLCFRPGSSFWLAHHNVSMSFRRVQRGHEGLSVGGIIGALILAIIIIVPLAITTYMGIKSLDARADALIANFASGIMLFFFITGVSTTMMAMVENYTDRGDLDLLLTSPMRVENIVAAKLYSSVWRDFALYFLICVSLFTLPIILIDFKYLWFIPAAIGFSLILSSFSFSTGQLILQVFGAAKGRKITRTIGAFLSISWIIFLIFQRPIITKIIASNPQLSGLEIEKYTWIGRAFAGDYAPALLLLALGVASFALARRSAASGFAKIAAQLMGSPEEELSNAKQKDAFKFSTKLPLSLISKEWRIMRRDPMTYVQAFAPMAGLLPAMMQGFMTPDGRYVFTPIVYPAIATVAAGQIVLALAWVAVSLEDASDLLNVSPQKQSEIILAKAMAVMIPGLLIILLFSLLCLFHSLWLAGICFAFGLISIFSSAIIEFLRPRPTKRVKLTQRPDRSMISVFVSLGLSISWAIGANMLAKGEDYWWISTIVGFTILIIAIATSPKLRKQGLKNAFSHL